MARTQPSTLCQQVSESLWHHTYCKKLDCPGIMTFLPGISFYPFLFKSSVLGELCILPLALRHPFLGGAPHSIVHLCGFQARRKGPKETLLIPYEESRRTSVVVRQLVMRKPDQETSTARDSQLVTWLPSLPTLWLGRAEMPYSC